MRSISDAGGDFRYLQAHIQDVLTLIARPQYGLVLGEEQTRASTADAIVYLRDGLTPYVRAAEELEELADDLDLLRMSFDSDMTWARITACRVLAEYDFAS